MNERSFITSVPVIFQGSQASILTNNRKKIKNIGIFLKDEDEEEEEEEEDEKPAPELLGRGRRTAVLDSRTRVSPNLRRNFSALGGIQRYWIAGLG